MRIGVLADTHDCLPDFIVGHLSMVDEIWHLGDVCSPKTIAPLEDKPLWIVRGNCDSSSRWPITLNLTREGIHFHLVHAPSREPPPETDVVIHGHTHTPRDEITNGVRFLNPGAVFKPRNSSASFGILEIADGVIKDWEIIPL